MPPETEDTGGLVGLLKRALAAPSTTPDASGLSPELRAQGITPDMPRIVPAGPQDLPGASTPATAPTPVAPPAPVVAPQASPVGPPAPTPEQMAAMVPKAPQAGGRKGPAAPTPPNDAPPTDRTEEGDRIEPAQASPEAPAAPTSALSAVGVTDPTVARFLAAQQARDAELRGAQTEAARQHRLAMAENSVETGFGFGSEAGRAARLANADRSTRDVAARQEAASKGLEYAGKEQAFISDADAANPNSAINVGMRDFFEKSTGKKIDPRLTAKQVPEMAKLYKDAEDARMKGVEETGRNTREGLKTTSEEKRAREQNQTTLAAARIAHPNEGGTGEVAPGYRQGNVKLAPAEGQKFREGVAEADSLKGELKQLSDSVGLHGTTMVGEEGAKQRALAQSAQLRIKKMFQLGAISKDDAERMSALARDPSTFSAKFTRNKNIQEGYKTYSDLIDRGVDTQARSLGLQGPTRAGAAPPAARAGWERMPDGTKFPVDAKGNRIGPAERQ